MGVHKNAEHESGYFEDEEEDDEVPRRVICVKSNREVVRDKSDDNLAEISCYEERIEPDTKSKYRNTCTGFICIITGSLTCHVVPGRRVFFAVTL
jgi:hypothetical protein